MLVRKIISVARCELWHANSRLLALFASLVDQGAAAANRCVEPQSLQVYHSTACTLEHNPTYDPSTFMLCLLPS